VNEGRYRRKSSAPVSGKMSSSAGIQVAPAQFLLHLDHVEYGGHVGGHSLAWGGLHRRRWPETGLARVSGFGGLRRKEEKLRLPRCFIGSTACAGGQQ
jgi:hypothetical protein